MDNGYTKQVRERILMAEDGAVFATSDFADIADKTSIRQSLKRLVENVLLLIAFYSPSWDLGTIYEKSTT